MKNFGKQWLLKFIPALLVLITGIAGIGSIAGATLSVASGSPIKDVVKDYAVDQAKETAINTLFGSAGDQSSILNVFNKTKYQYVSDKESGPLGYIMPGWYAEVYRIDKTVYAGNRRFNKSNGVNFAWDMKDVTDFELGDFKNNTAYRNSYIAYNQETFNLIIGELNKAKLDGFVLVYDQYYDTYKFKYFNKGKDTHEAIVLGDSEINYINEKDNTILATCDFNNSTAFEKASGIKGKLPKDIDSISYHSNILSLKLDDRSYEIIDNRQIVYNSKTCEFSGNAYEFNCKYFYNENEFVDYEWTTMQRLGISCSDGTVGEVKTVEESDNSDEAVTIKAISISLIKLGAHTTVDVLVEGKIGALNTAVEIATGTSISDMINSQVDILIDNGVEFIEENDINDIGVVNDIKDGLNNITGNRDYEKERKEKQEEMEKVLSEPNSDGSYTLPSGITIRIE